MSAVKRVTLGVVLVAGVLSAYYFIGRRVYLNAVKSAFPQLPIDSDCYYLPWPAGPKVIGQFAPNDPTYLHRDTIERDSQGLHLTIYDSNGMFEIETE